MVGATWHLLPWAQALDSAGQTPGGLAAQEDQSLPLIAAAGNTTPWGDQSCPEGCAFQGRWPSKAGGIGCLVPVTVRDGHTQPQGLFIYLFIYIFKIFFLMWTIFKVFTLNLLYIIGLPWWLRW